MPNIKTLSDRVGDIKGEGLARREEILLGVYNAYKDSFNKEKAVRYFESLPVNLVWQGKYKFKLDAHGLVFAPATMADFISLCDSINYKLSPDLYSVDNLSEEEKSQLKKMI